MLEDLSNLTKQKYVAPYFFAGIRIGLGQNDRAMEYLERSYEEHSHWLIYLHIDPSIDALRDDPCFQDLLRVSAFPHWRPRFPPEGNQGEGYEAAVGAGGRKPSFHLGHYSSMIGAKGGSMNACQPFRAGDGAHGSNPHARLTRA